MFKVVLLQMMTKRCVAYYMSYKAISYTFFHKQLHVGVNVRVAYQIYAFKVKSCLGISKLLILRNLSNDCFLLYDLNQPQAIGIDRSGIKANIGKINNFSIVTSICPKYYCTQLICAKNSCGERKVTFSELKIDKVFFYSESNQHFLHQRF